MKKLTAQGESVQESHSDPPKGLGGGGNMSRA